MIPIEDRDETIRRIYCSICYELYKIGRRVEQPTVKQILDNSIKYIQDIQLDKNTIDEERSLKVLYSLEGYIQLTPPTAVKGEKKDKGKSVKGKGKEIEEEVKEENKEYPDITNDFYSQLLSYDCDSVLNYLNENSNHPNYLKFVGLLCNYYYQKVCK